MIRLSGRRGPGFNSRLSPFTCAEPAQRFPFCAEPHSPRRCSLQQNDGQDHRRRRLAQPRSPESLFEVFAWPGAWTEVAVCCLEEAAVGQGLSISPGVYVATPILFFRNDVGVTGTYRYYLNERGEETKPGARDGKPKRTGAREVPSL